MAEKEYIERTRALDIAMGTPAYYFLKIEPAADVVEVRHGEWNVTENRQHLDVGCSICKSSFYVYKQGQYRIDRSNYCPNCGAKMDGKGEG